MTVRELIDAGICPEPDCHNTLIREGRCLYCPVCGWSLCK